MHVHHIAAGEHTGDAGLHILVDHSALGVGVHGDPGLPGQLIFRDQADAEQDGIHIKFHFGARDGAAVLVHLGNDSLFHAGFALNIHDGMGQIQRDVEVLQTLHDVAGQAAGIRHDLHAGQHFGPFQRHAAGHDQADVAAAEDEHPLAYQITLHVDIALGSTGGVDAGGAGARDADGTAGAFPAAHAEDDASGFQNLIALFPADTVDLFVRGDLQHHGAQLHPHAGGMQQFNASAGILRAGELLAKAVQAKAIVDALVQDAAQFVVPLQNQNIAQAVLPCAVSCGKACRAAADDDQINHGDFPPAWFRTVRRWYRLYPAARPAG